jgi:hypothetical protein
MLLLERFEWVSGITGFKPCHFQSTIASVHVSMLPPSTPLDVILAGIIYLSIHLCISSLSLLSDFFAPPPPPPRIAYSTSSWGIKKGEKVM